MEDALFKSSILAAEHKIRIYFVIKVLFKQYVVLLNFYNIFLNCVFPSAQFKHKNGMYLKTTSKYSVYKAGIMWISSKTYEKILKKTGKAIP